jgi:hypothetical protein
MELSHQIVNSPEMEAQLPRFLMTGGCLLLATTSGGSFLVQRTGNILSFFTSLFSGVDAEFWRTDSVQYNRHMDRIWLRKVE